MAQLEELEAEYLGERHRFDNVDGDVVIAEAHANGTINGPIVLKGPAEVDELRTRHSYRFYGKWSNYKRRDGEVEKQFHFQTFVAVQPHNRDGIIAYLRHAGEGLGFGAVRAAALWDAFAGDAVKIFREDPERVADELARRRLALPGRSAQAIAEILKSEQQLENCTIELTDLLAGRGLPKTVARKAIQEWGNLAAGLLRRDPYKLMRFRGVGFKRCDQLYLNLGLPPGRLKRQALCVWFSVASSTNGDTYLPLQAATAYLRSAIGGAEIQPEKAVRLAERAGIVRLVQTIGNGGPICKFGGSHTWIAEGKRADHEALLAQRIARDMS